MILQNGFRDTVGVFRTYGATASNNCYPQGTLGNYNLTGMMRNITAGEGITSDKVGVPLGYLAGGAWILPQKPGNLSARSTADFGLSAAGSALMGYPIEGSSEMTFTVADADGQLISSGEGSAAFAITVADLLLTASLGGTGAASFEITAANALLGAEASLTGETSFSITVGNAQAYPLNDASPLREGTASMAVTGTLIPYAIGSMSGSTADNSLLTVDAITSGVWRALASQFADSGTMGAKLNTASSGGVDMDALAQAIRTDLAVELARIDRPISTRATPADIFAAI